LYSKRYTSKITSGTILALLAFSGFVVFLALPISSAKAVTTGSGIITLSQNSGVPVFNSYYTDFGDWITVTGTGFPAGQDNIQIVMIPSTTTITATISADCSTNDLCDLGSNTLDHTVQQYFNPSIAGTHKGTVMSDANGWFKMQFATPVIQGGSYLVYAIYPTTTGNVVTLTVPFTVKQGISVVSDWTGTSSMGVGDLIQLAGVGFGANEGIQPIPASLFTNTAGNPLGVNTGNVPGTNEGEFQFGPETGNGFACNVVNHSYCVGAEVGGSHTITILGLSSGDSVTQTFTINPTLYFLDPTCTNPIFSIDTTMAGSKVCVHGAGFAKSATIALSGSVQIGGATTIESELDSDANGNFPNTVVTLSSANAGVGMLSISLGGMTFSYANGNIYQPNAGLFDNLAGVLIGSHANGGAITSFPDPSGNSVRVGQNGALIGFGYLATQAYGAVGPFVLKDQNAHSITFLTPGVDPGGDATNAHGTDANGAFVYYYTVPTVQHFKFTLHDNTVNGAPDSSFTITPDVRFNTNIASAGDVVQLVAASHGGLDSMAGLNYYIAAGGNTAQDLTVYINGNLWDSCSTNGNLCDANIVGGAPPIGDLAFAANLQTLGASGITATDLPQGSYNTNITGSYKGDWTVGRFKNAADPAQGTLTQVTIDPVALAGSLSSIQGAAGTIVAINTGTIGTANAGIHGLAASTQYKIMWDTNTQLGTFTTNSAGQVPVGTQFTVPAGTSGTHVVDIQTMSGTSAIWGQVENHKIDQFSNLEYLLTTSLIVTPSIGSGGGVMTLSGNGLPASTLLYLTVCGAPYNDFGPEGVSFAQFTSTNTGAVPANVTFTLPQFANPGSETGALITWHITDYHGCTVTGVKGIAKFAYQATMSLSSTVGPQGSTITVSTHGLDSGGLYDIVFNYAPISTNIYTYTGQIIGVILADNNGQGTAQVTIPAAASAGTYNIGLVAAGGNVFIDPFASVLNVIPTFTVGGTSCTLSTCQFTISGTPTESNGYLSVAYSNPGTSQVTGVIVVSVQNALGQTVYITTATISPGAGQTVTGLADLSLLPSGSYTANVFVVTLAGGSISQLTSGVPIHV